MRRFESYRGHFVRSATKAQVSEYVSPNWASLFGITGSRPRQSRARSRRGILLRQALPALALSLLDLGIHGVGDQPVTLAPHVLIPQGRVHGGVAHPVHQLTGAGPGIGRHGVARVAKIMKAHRQDPGDAGASSMYGGWSLLQVARASTFESLLLAHPQKEASGCLTW